MDYTYRENHDHIPQCYKRDSNWEKLSKGYVGRPLNVGTKL